MKVLLTTLAACAVVITGSAAGATTTYPDALGDARCCNDIAGVTVTNDAGGAITFRIDLPNDPAPGPGRPVLIWLNTDLDRSTGTWNMPQGQRLRRSGADYRIVLNTIGGPEGTRLERLSGGRPTDVGALTSAYDRGWTVTLDRRAVGGPEAFEFFVFGVRQEPGLLSEVVDDAPDAAQGIWGWRYDTGLPSLRPSLAAGLPSLLPNPPRAGRRLIARLPFELTTILANRVAVSCSATAGGRGLAPSPVGDFGLNVNTGVAVCAWVLPKTARGKLVRGSMTITAGSAAVTRRFSSRAR